MKFDRSVSVLSAQYSVLGTQNSVASIRPAAWTLALVAVVALHGGCSTGEFPTAPVKGRVICQGKPVPHVMVFFEPLQTAKVMGRSGFAIADENGNFVMSSYGEKDGAVIGKHRVRVGPPHPQDFPNYKCECYLNSEVDLIEEVEVKKGNNEFELVLKKKTGREPPPRKDD